jgi:hypothetical protein
MADMKMSDKLFFVKYNVPLDQFERFDRSGTKRVFKLLIN